MKSRASSSRRAKLSAGILAALFAATVGETPAAAQTPASVGAPAPAPTLRPAATHRTERFIVGDYLFGPKVFNEFSPGNTGAGFSYAARGALEFRLFRLRGMVAGDYRSFRYPHNDDGSVRPGAPGFVTVIGGYGQTDIPAFIAKDTEADGSAGLQLAAPRIYLDISYLHREENYGYPKQNGVGLGIDKLPDFDQTLSVYGSLHEYPNVHAGFTYPQDAYTCPPGGTAACAPGSLAGSSAPFADRVLTYQFGVTFLLAGARDPFGLFIDGGFLGDSIRGKTLSPGNASHAAAYLGLGLKL